MTNITLSLSAALALITSGVALANDGNAELPLGGLISYKKNDSISMEKEVLTVSTGRIMVDYEFLNTAETAQHVLMAFPLPAYDVGGPSFSWMGAPKNFNVTVNGAQFPFETKVRAKACVPHDRTNCSEKDVTAVLRKAGLTDAQIALFPAAAPWGQLRPGQLRPPKLTKLQTSTLFKKGLLDYPADWDDTGLPLPRWTVEVTYLWRITFPAGSRHKVSHSYQPMLAGGAYTFMSEEQVSGYCGSDALIEKWRKVRPEREETDYPGWPVAVVPYILTTANTWKGPIKEFTLRLETSSPEELVTLCFPGKLEQTGSTAYEVRLTDFSPTEELRVVFLGPNTFTYPDMEAPEIRTRR